MAVTAIQQLPRVYRRPIGNIFVTARSTIVPVRLALSERLGRSAPTDAIRLWSAIVPLCRSIERASPAQKGRANPRFPVNITTDGRSPA